MSLKELFQGEKIHGNPPKGLATPPGESRNGGALRAKYVYMNGERVARFATNTNSVQYFFTDHLGSTVLTVDNAGAVKNRSIYKPYGEYIKNVLATTNDDFKYTGKERDDELGLDLDYFGARYYHPRLKIFTSSDPLWNKTPGWGPYVYTLNNPLKFVDPDGRDVEVVIGEPYEGHKYGHMALRVVNDNTNTVYDFGRYGNTRGLFDQYGDGILNVRSGDKYIASENSIRSSIGFTFKTSIDQDNSIINFFEGLQREEGAKKLYSIDQGTGARYKLNKDRDYHWSDNNCVTISIEALVNAGLFIFEEGTYKPTDALKQLMDNDKGSKKKEYRKNEQKKEEDKQLGADVDEM